MTNEEIQAKQISRKTKYKALLAGMRKVPAGGSFTLHPPNKRDATSVRQAITVYLYKDAGWDAVTTSMYKDDTGFHLSVFRKSSDANTKDGQLKILREIIESPSTDDLTRRFASAIEAGVYWWKGESEDKPIGKILDGHVNAARKYMK
jgi:hypothetical protein